MRHWLACVVLAASSSTLGFDDPAPSVKALTSALAGEWTGTLEYRDYTTDKRVTLPTTLKATAVDDGRAVEWKFRYDEGKGRFVESKSVLKFDAKNARLIWESESGQKTEYALSRLDAFATKKTGELTLTSSGKENGVEVEFRQTLKVDKDTVELRKESKKPGGQFAFRNAYVFKRVKPKAN